VRGPYFPLMRAVNPHRTAGSPARCTTRRYSTWLPVPWHGWEYDSTHNGEFAGDRHASGFVVSRCRSTGTSLCRPSAERRGAAADANRRLRGRGPPPGQREHLVRPSRCGAYVRNPRRRGVGDARPALPPGVMREKTDAARAAGALLRRSTSEGLIRLALFPTLGGSPFSSPPHTLHLNGQKAGRHA